MGQNMILHCKFYNICVLNYISTSCLAYLTMHKLHVMALNSFVEMVPRQRFPTSAPQGFLNPAGPDRLGRGTDLFSLGLSNKKNDKSQHHNSHPV